MTRCELDLIRWKRRDRARSRRCMRPEYFLRPDVVNRRRKLYEDLIRCTLDQLPDINFETVFGNDHYSVIGMLT